MITFRHFLTSLVAVFLALAVGIALGGGLLSDVDDDAPATTAAPQDTAAPGAAFSDAFDNAVAPVLLSGKLTDKEVAVVTVPGADEQVLTAVADQITGAGGKVSGRYSLTEQMVQPEQKALVDTLGSQVMTQQGKDAVTADATTYDRIGQLLGLAISTTNEGGDAPNGKQAAIMDSLRGADLVSFDGAVARRAPLVLFVLGDEPAVEGGDAILSGLVTGLSRTSVGLVVAGDVADGGEGQLGRLRADPVSAVAASVDGIEVPAGRVSTVLALARSLSADGGAFGASGADGAVPLG